MSAITTHILDVSLGRPAADVSVTLERRTPLGDWDFVGAGRTNADGRLLDLMGDGALTAGAYRLRFDTGGYFAGRRTSGFYPEVTVTFEVADISQHYHVPLLMSPFGYSTYRGS